MRINKFIARATGLSRRGADQAVAAGQVTVNGKRAEPGADVSGSDVVRVRGEPVSLPSETFTVMLNKPAGYVCSRDGQGSRTVYDLLPPEMRALKPVGRLDKDSSGLLLLTNDGDLANNLTHPRYNKEKTYVVELHEPLSEPDRRKIGQGVKLEDGISKLQIKNPAGKSFTVVMSEGRNRQIRRTFEALGYTVTKLHRTKFGPYALENLGPGKLIRYREDDTPPSG